MSLASLARAALALAVMAALAVACGGTDPDRDFPSAAGDDGGGASLDATDDGATPPLDASPKDAGAHDADASHDAGADAGTFGIEAAAAVTAKSVTVTFDAPPNAAEATTAANYEIPGLTVSAPTLAGNVVTLTTTAQDAIAYTVTVSNVTRAKDGLPLSQPSATFDGRAPFGVTVATSIDATTVTVTFDAPPDPAEATTLANYVVAPALALEGTPVLAGSTVTLRTAPQAAVTYNVTVTGVTRAADDEPLDVASAAFAGTAPVTPTVTNVEVLSTNPNNGTTPFNTGTTTVKLTGTSFATVDCAGGTKGVRLDDLDGAGAPAGTTATACTVVSDTELTATFPAGIRTNGAIGWNVVATNLAGSNATSDVPFVPTAGLVISEVCPGATGFAGAADHEFVEIYNRTATSLDVSPAGMNLKLHVRNGSGTQDTNKTLAFVTNGVVPSHGFLLVVSSASDASDAWYASRDVTYSAGLVGNGGVYISLSATDDAQVLDKVGWGTQPAPGFEGAAFANVANGQNAERKPAGGAGHGTDTDSNVDDFVGPAATFTPRGTADGPEP